MQRRGSRGIVIIAVIFFVMGIVWLSAIYQRMNKFNPKVIRASVSQVVDQPVVQETKVKYKRVRSPYVKDYHIALFWVIVGFEILISTCYFYNGIGLIRMYPFARIFSLCTLYGDIAYKMLVVGFMRLCAEPISKLTENKDMLSSYFLPDTSLWSQVSYTLAGLKMLHPEGFVILILFIICVFVGIYFLSRREIKAHYRF